MIEPINQNVNIKSLQPVEIPHFTGGAKIVNRTAKADSFKKTQTVKLANENSTKFNKNDILDAAKKGAKEGLGVIKDAANTGIEFTGALVKSIFKDTIGVVKEKGVKTITTINDVI